jgi:DNA invertase Pin-like site-specific DNA recombinase
VGKLRGVSMRAVIYARQSKDVVGDAAAVGRQIADCRELAHSNGWEVVKEIADNDRSATTGERPGWRDLLAGIDAGRYDVLVAWHPDRLYRRLRDLVDLIEVAERRSLRIAAVRSGDLDLGSPTGRMVASLLGSVAAYEVQHKGQRQRAANRQRAARGHVGWSLRPYGYERVNGREVIVEHEAKVLREAAERVLAGEATHAVVKDFNRRGLTPTTGGRWQTTPLRRMLISPRLAGRAVLKGEDFGVGDWPPIFDTDTHDRLVALFSDPRRRHSPSPRTKYLLSGLLTCGRCQSVMFAMPAGRTYLTYVCKDGNGHVTRKVADVDGFVEQVVIERLSRRDALELLVPDVDVDALRARVVELRTRRDALAEMLAAGLLTPASVRVQAEKLTDQITVTEMEIADALGESPATALVTADDVGLAWQALPLLAKREVIKTLLTVTIQPIGKGRRRDFDAIEITWRTS